MKQWGVAVQLYATDNEDFFPDNLKAVDLSWCSTNVQRFWAQYLIPQLKTKTEKDKSHVVFCPTDKWHRVADLWRGTAPTADTGPILCGYFYLPHRDTRSGWPYNSHGLEAWHSKRTLGGFYADAPILIDRLQAVGSVTPNGKPTRVDWFTMDNNKRVPTAVHRLNTDAPAGGNFLFEDGHVTWYKTEKVGVGTGTSGWVCFYKIEVNSSRTNAPAL
jgi:hypothetical protein